MTMCLVEQKKSMCNQVEKMIVIFLLSRPRTIFIVYASSSDCEGAVTAKIEYLKYKSALNFFVEKMFLLKINKEFSKDAGCVMRSRIGRPMLYGSETWCFK